MTKILLLLCLLGLHLSHEGQENHFQQLNPGKYRFQNGDGKYLAHVLNRSARNPFQVERVSVSDSATDSSTVWEVKQRGNGIRISTQMNRYLLVSQKYGDVILGSQKQGYIDDFSSRQNDGKWVFRTRSASYLGICTSRYGEMTVCARDNASPQSSFTWTLTEVTDV